jgi:hypothetical protein
MTADRPRLRAFQSRPRQKSRRSPRQGEIRRVPILQPCRCRYASHSRLRLSALCLPSTSTMSFLRRRTRNPQCIAGSDVVAGTVGHAPTQILTALCQRRFAAHRPTLPPPASGGGRSLVALPEPGNCPKPLAYRPSRARDIDCTCPAATGENGTQQTERKGKAMPLAPPAAARRVDVERAAPGPADRRPAPTRSSRIRPGAGDRPSGIRGGRQVRG